MAIKTVDLVWNGAFWCDRITGVKIPEGIYPPPDQQAEAIGTTLEWWTGKGPPPDYRGGAETVHQHFAELFQSGHHPFDKSFAVTYEQVQKMIDDAFRNRTSQSSTMAYFAPPDDNLVTYGAIRDDIVDFHSKLARVNWRIEQLERPWYKRWFNR